MFARQIHRIARRQNRRGDLTNARYQEILQILDNPVATQQWENAVAAQVGSPWREKEPDWNGIWEWIKAHWIDILKVFISLLPLLILLQPGPESDE